MTGFGAGLDLIRPWLTTAFIGSILAMLVKLYIDNRRLKLAEKSRDQDFQLEVSADGRTNLQFVIDNLVRDITAQREATAAQAKLHDACQEAMATLRNEYAEQSRKLDGVVRQFLQFQMDHAKALPLGQRTPLLSELKRQFDELAAQEAAGPREARA